MDTVYNIAATHTAWRTHLYVYNFELRRTQIEQRKIPPKCKSAASDPLDLHKPTQSDRKQCQQPQKSENIQSNHFFAP